MLKLRRPTKEDETEIRDCYQRSVSLHHPWAFEPKDYSAYLAQANRLFLYLEDTGEIVGTFNISNIVRGFFQSAYLGYEVFAPHQNKSYMSKGLVLLLDYAFKELNLHRLEANVQPENIHSIKLLSANGFVKEGHERWAIMNDNWQS